MFVCVEAAKRFFQWLTTTGPHYRTHDLGDALACWLEADSGVEQVAEKYSTFLQMVIVILLNPQLIAGINVKINDNGEILVIRVPEGHSWLDKIGEDVFDRAILRNRERRGR